jgi:hypothetical protein
MLHIWRIIVREGGREEKEETEQVVNKKANINIK